MNKDTFPFVVYLIHACADRWGKTPKQVYNELKATKCALVNKNWTRETEK